MVESLGDRGFLRWLRIELFFPSGDAHRSLNRSNCRDASFLERPNAVSEVVVSRQGNLVLADGNDFAGGSFTFTIDVGDFVFGWIGND